MQIKLSLGILSKNFFKRKVFTQKKIDKKSKSSLQFNANNENTFRSNIKTTILIIMVLRGLF